MSEPTKIDEPSETAETSETAEAAETAETSETSENTDNTDNNDNTGTMVPPQDIVFPLLQPGKRYSKCKK